MTEHAAAAPSGVRSWLGRLAWSDWASAGLLAALAVVMLHNAEAFAWVSGYDAQHHVEYARYVVDQWRLPSDGAFYTPPLFYVLAGWGVELWEAVGSTEPVRAGQYLSALCTLTAGIALVVLVRLLFPGRRILHVAALAFFVASPTVIKSAAMFHPQPLALALSTVALALAAHLLVRNRYPWWEVLALFVALGAAQLVRSVAVWTAGVVFVTLAAGLLRRANRRRLAVIVGVVVAGAILIPLPWYSHLQSTYSAAILGRPGADPLTTRSFSFYVDPGLPDLFQHPHRQELPTRFWPVLYADTWGDHFGAWTWAPPRELTPKVERGLVVQSFAGLLPTLVGLAGWLALLGLTLTRLRKRFPYLLVALLPGVALLGMLYYAAISTSADADTVKGIFALTAIPAWAVCFGFAVDTMWMRSHRLGIAASVVLAACGLVCLDFGWL